MYSLPFTLLTTQIQWTSCSSLAKPHLPFLPQPIVSLSSQLSSIHNGFRQPFTSKVIWSTTLNARAHAHTPIHTQSRIWDYLLQVQYVIHPRAMLFRGGGGGGGGWERERERKREREKETETERETETVRDRERDREKHSNRQRDWERLRGSVRVCKWACMWVHKFYYKWGTNSKLCFVSYYQPFLAD